MAASVTAAQITQVSQQYVALFGRAPDAEGLGYWVQQLVNGKTIQTVGNDMFNVSAARTFYPAFASNETIIKSFYTNVLGRAADADGLAYWTAKLNAPTATPGQIINDMIVSVTSYTGADADAVASKSLFNNKVAVGEYYGATLQGTAAGASAAISKVTATTDVSTDAAKSAAVTAGGGSTSGSTFTLTTSVDTITGTAGNDSISAAAGTFGALDSIDGGNGVDTLSVASIAAYAGGATLTSIEKLVLSQATAGGFNASGIVGLTDVSSQSSSVDITVTALGSAANIAVLNQDTAVTVTYADTAVAGAADAVKLTLNNVAQAGGTAVALNNTTTLTGATGIETLTIDAAGAAGTATSTVTVNTNATQSLTKVVFTGASAANITLGANVTTSAATLDASAMTGNLTLSGIGVATTTATGGAGNDSFNFLTGAYSTADVVNGGAGTDSLGAFTAQLAAVTAVNANVTNVETIRVVDDFTADATINLANFGAKNVRIAAQAVATTLSDDLIINNLATDANIRFDGATIAAGGSLTLNVKDATLPGTADNVTLDLRGGAVTYTAAMAGVETVNVNLSNATGTATLALTDAAMTTFKLINTGAQAFTNAGTALGAAVATVDLSGVTGTGTNTIVMTAAATTGVSLTGSANADTITGTNNVDLINVGGGNDIVTGGNGADRINVGAGTDQIVISATGQTTSLATAATLVSGTTVISATADIITGMGVGDTINLAAIDGATITGAVGTTIAAASGTTASITRGDYNSTTGIWTTSATGADSILAYDADAANAAAATVTEFVVLVGVTAAASTAAAGIITLA